jgi:hypothetical protein
MATMASPKSIITEPVGHEVVPRETDEVVIEDVAVPAAMDGVVEAVAVAVESSVAAHGATSVEVAVAVHLASRSNLHSQLGFWTFGIKERIIWALRSLSLPLSYFRHL